MDLRAAVEATYDAGTASIRATDAAGLNYEGELRFDGPATRRTTYPHRDGPPEQVMQLNGDVWMWASDHGWVRWRFGASPHRGDGVGVLDLVGALTEVRPDGEGGYVGHFTPPAKYTGPLRQGGLVRVALDDQGRVRRVIYPGPDGDEIVEYSDFGRAVEITAPDEYEILDFRVREPARPTRFAGRNSPVRRARRARRRR